MWWPFTKAAPPPELPRPSPVTSESVHGHSLDLDRFSRDIAREFSRNLYIWRCVDAIAGLASSVPLKVVKTDDESQLTAAELDVERLLARGPNPQMSSPALMYFVATSLAVANKAFMKIARGIGGSAAELWPLGPDEVQVVYHQNSRLISHFETNGVDGRIQKHPVDDDGRSDMIFIRRPALNRQTDLSPAAVAAPSAETFNRILQRAADIAGNSSNISGILATDGEMAETNLLEIKGKLQEYATGQAQSGGTLVTANAKWQLTKLTEDPSAALSVDIKNSLARDICSCFGVPVQLMGLPGGESAYNATTQARVGLLSDVVLPSYVGVIVAELNRALLHNGARIVADVDNVPTLMSWRQTLTESAQRAKFMSTNERRQMVGLPRFEDQPHLPSANVPLSCWN